MLLRPGGTVDGITASIGLALAPLHGVAGMALMAAADAALYRAKAQGRDRIALAESGVADTAATPDSRAFSLTGTER